MDEPIHAGLKPVEQTLLAYPSLEVLLPYAD